MIKTKTSFWKLQLFWKFRRLILEMTRREIAMRYRGSTLGVLWSFFCPLLLLFIYSFVFTKIFRVHFDNPEPFFLDNVIIYFCNLSAFSIINELWGASPFFILNNPNYVKKTVFPLGILPIVYLLNTTFHACVNFLVIIIAMTFLRGSLPVTILLLPLVLLPLAMISLGGAYIFSAVAVYIQDLKNFMGIFTTILLFVTPILYSPKMVHDQVPGAAFLMLKLNPLAAIFEFAREVTVYNQLPNLTSYACVTVFSAIFMVFGYWTFIKLRPGFADVI